MNAITVLQPWATLIAEGLKPFEFRAWPAPRGLIGQRIAIHAGARPVKRVELSELIYKLGREDWRATGIIEPLRAIQMLERWFNAPKELPLASIVCTVQLGDPIRNVELAQTLGVPAVNDSDRQEHSVWGWPLTEVKPMRPVVPARGAQGFWSWNDAQYRERL